MDRVIIQWTDTAKTGLAKLPRRVRRGLLDKIGRLRDVPDPTKVHKPLTGPLQGYYRVCFSRYRAIYSVESETLASGDVLHRYIVRFVAAGIRKEGDKNDIYRFAKRLLEMGVIDLTPSEDADEDSAQQPPPAE